MKQLTLEELRDQFERSYRFVIETKETDKRGIYYDSELQSKWQAYRQCAKINGILKDI